MGNRELLVDALEHVSKELDELKSGQREILELARENNRLLRKALRAQEKLKKRVDQHDGLLLNALVTGQQDTQN